MSLVFRPSDVWYVVRDPEVDDSEGPMTRADLQVILADLMKRGGSSAIAIAECWNPQLPDWLTVTEMLELEQAYGESTLAMCSF
jgi:hypothetical protein